MDAVYGYQAVNVEAQLRSSSSLLHWTRRLIATRASYRAFGRGTLTFLEPGNRKVIAYLREYENEAMLCVANLSRVPQAVELDLARFEQRVPVEIMGKASFAPIGKLPYLLTLAGHGYFAFQLSADAKPPAWHEERLPYRPLPVLVLAANWRSELNSTERARDARRLILNMTRERLRDEILVPYLRSRRWFSAKSQPIKDAFFGQMSEWNTPEGSWLMGILNVDLAAGGRQYYFFPLSIEWESRNYDPLEKLGAWSFAKVRQKERMGVLYAAFGNPRFARALARAMGTNAEVPLGRGRLRFSSTSIYSELASAIDEDVKVPTLEQSNTGVFFGSRMYLKGYARLHGGVNPEFEVGRFLTDVSPYSNIAPVVGAVEYVGADGGDPLTLAILREYIDNQGDAWAYTLQYLERSFATTAGAAAPLGADITAAGTMSPAAAPEGRHAFYFSQLAVLGRRVAEMHRAFAHHTGDPGFEPEAVTSDDVAQWKASVVSEAERTFAALASAKVPAEVQPAVDELLAARESLLERISALGIDATGLFKTRYHGDLHLGQVLLAQNDFIIIDFEGEPARPIDERRRKHSPLRDVAGMLRSFNYASHSALRAASTGVTDARATLAAAIETWERGAVSAFLAAYTDAAQGLASVPARPADLKALTDLFVFEKALYELRYELDNRPDWIPIPVQGLLALMRP